MIELGMHTLDMTGMTADDCRKSLDTHGIQAVSWMAGGQHYDTEIDAHIEAAATLGCPYMCWGYAPANNAEEMEKAYPVMHKAASMIRAAGMTMIYHNHDHEFKNHQGDLIAFDWLMSHFDKELVQCELDIGWVKYGGEDIVETIRKYDNRCPILHIRDIREISTRGEFIEIGNGILDFTSILQAGGAAGTEWAIVEHTKPLAVEPVQGMRIAAETLRPVISNLNGNK